jgi:hypothetical protein
MFGSSGISYCVVPVSFLVMAGMVNALSGEKTSEYGQHVIEWSLLVCVTLLLWAEVHADRLIRDQLNFLFSSQPLLGG